MLRQLLTAVLLLFLSACGSAIEPVSIVEVPYIEADLNGEFWEADNYFVSEVKRLPNPAGEGLLTRFTVSGFTGTNSQVSFTIDIADTDNAVGRYSSIYGTGGGLGEMSWFDENTGSLRYFELAAGDTTANVRVRRHSLSRKVLTGTFEGTLIERGNPSSKIVIENGVFSNLEY